MDDLTAAGTAFLEMYTRCVAGCKLVDEDFAILFTHITDAFDVLAEFCDRNTSREVRHRFVQDLLEVFAVTSSALLVLTDILGKLIRLSSPVVVEEFWIAVRCFQGTVQVQRLTVPPFYRKNVIPVITLVGDLLSTNAKFLSIVGPPNSGKSHTVPLLLAMKMCQGGLKQRILIVCESSPVLVRSVAEFITDFGEENVVMLSSAREVMDNLDESHMLPVIAVLSQLEAIQLFTMRDNNQKLVSRCMFIIDDINARGVETDVLQTLAMKAIRSASVDLPDQPAQLTFLAEEAEQSYTANLRSFQEFQLDSPLRFEVKTKVVTGTPHQIVRTAVLRAATNLLVDWGSVPPDVPVGTMLVFMPGESLAFRLAKGLRTMFGETRRRTARQIIPLSVEMVPTDTYASFFVKVRAEINHISDERRADFGEHDPLFFVPIVIHKHSTDRAIEVVTKPLEPRLKDRLVMVVILATSNIPLGIPDVTAVLDTGIHEVEYFDVESGFTYIQEEPLPETHRKARASIVGRQRIGINILFDVPGVKRPAVEVPAVRRIDLSKACLALRRYGVELEKIQGLPTEPDFALRDASIKLLQRVGILDPMRRTTDLGRKAVRYSFLHPQFAAAMVTLGEGGVAGQLFACAVFYIIEHGYEMISDMGNQAFSDCFEPRSDLVTVLLSFLNVLGEQRDTVEQLCELISGVGFNPVYFFELRDHLVTLSGGRQPREIAVEMRNWMKGKPFDAVNGLILSARELNSDWFAKRRAMFVRIMNAGSDPYIEFRCETELIGTKDRILQISRRPGWKGLVTPGSCYILSVRSNKTHNVTYGSLLHECTSTPAYGVVSRPVDACLKSPFFVALFEAYLGHKTHNTDFVGIQMSKKDDPKTAFIIHLTRNGDQTLLNYCPKNEQVERLTTEAIATLRPLLPFVPRSLLVKHDNPECAVEIFYVGAKEYTTLIHFFDEPNAPKVYNLNADILKYLSQNRNRISSEMPQYRFAITGECFVYERRDGAQVDIPLEYPDTRPTLDSVFSACPSHLVLLVETREPPLPGKQIQWTNAGPKKSRGFVHEFGMIRAAGSIIESRGSVKKAADLFVVQLSNCLLRSDHGELPQELMNECNAIDPQTMNCSYYQLTQSIGRYVLGNRDNVPPVPIKELASAPAPGKKATRLRASFGGEMARTIATNLSLPLENIEVHVNGNLLFCRVCGIPKENTGHRKPADIYDQSYQPCAADAVVRRSFDKAMNAKVFHSSCVGFRLCHTQRQKTSADQFTATVASLVEKYGYTVTMHGEYVPEDGVGQRLGTIYVEICDPSIAIAFAQDVSAAINIDPTFDPTRMMTNTQAMMATIAQRKRALPACGEKYKNCSVEELKKLILQRAQRHVDHTRWNPKDIRVIAGGEVDKQDLLRRLIQEENKRVCFSVGDDCETDEAVPVTDPLYVYNQDGTFAEFAVCLQCMIGSFQYMLQAYFNPATHVLNFDAAEDGLEALPVIPSIDDNLVGNEHWPAVPFGSLLYTLMSDAQILGPYIKAWVAVTKAIAIVSHAHLVTRCPNHPRILLRTPADNRTIKCPHCNFILCGNCRTWHSMDQPCVEDLEGVKRCPRCRCPVFKTAGCNHMTCRCGCHWCYVCEAGFDVADQCYTHLRQAHGGIS